MKKKQSVRKYILTGLNREDGIPDEDDVPELTAEWFRKAKRFHELPKDLQQGLLSLKKRGRPKVAHPKRVKSFKLSPDVIEGIQSSGKGYNARVEAVLREALRDGRI